MVAVSVSADFKQVRKTLNRIERRQLPYATRLALKNTAAHIALKTLPRLMPRIFDRPTRWTLRAFYFYQTRDRRDLSAYVNIKDGGSRFPYSGGKAGVPAFQYLRVQMKGGTRAWKSTEKKLAALGILNRGEFVVPGNDMRLNRFGNLTGATYSKILADVQGLGYGIQTGFGQRTTTKGKKRFFYDPNLRAGGYPAIWERYGRGGKRIRPALLIVRKMRYRPRFDFVGLVRRASGKRFRREFDRAMARAIATARR